MHAGSAEQGFIQNCEEVFKGKYVDGDYHKDMNSPVFMTWFEYQLMPALKSPSIIVLDNASYHNMKAESAKFPKTTAKKAEIQDWFIERKINFRFLQSGGGVHYNIFVLESCNLFFIENSPNLWYVGIISIFTITFCSLHAKSL